MTSDLLIQITFHLLHFRLTCMNRIAGVVVMFAPDEAENGQVVVKTMGSGEQSSHDIDDVVSAVTSALSKEVVVSPGDV